MPSPGVARVIIVARVLSPKPMPSAMPVASAMTFFTAPPTSTHPYLDNPMFVRTLKDIAQDYKRCARTVVLKLLNIVDEHTREALTIIQTGKSMRFPVILVCEPFWRGLLSWFEDRTYYTGGDFNDDKKLFGDLKKLAAEVCETHDIPQNYFYYMAIPPDLFAGVTHKIVKNGLGKEEDGHWRRFIYEKPFGHDLASSQELNRLQHDAIFYDDDSTLAGAAVSFVREGIDEPQPIEAMPGVVQHTIDSLVAEAHRRGLRTVGLSQMTGTALADGWRGLLRRLNGVLEDAAGRRGAGFADAYAATRGHDICAEDAWIQGRTTEPGVA